MNHGYVEAATLAAQGCFVLCLPSRERDAFHMLWSGVIDPDECPDLFVEDDAARVRAHVGFCRVISAAVERP